ncbi:MAG: hypothetical protein Q8L37_06670 [Candidatus Gottesmanbacteria bacterium]|nr:hypothetical protein [Candidatus Gottesmanbacteria bacterium]
MKRTSRNSSHPTPWLPIDSRLIPPLFSFGHVRGIARLFLIIEILLALLVVMGTILVVVIKIVG